MHGQSTSTHKLSSEINQGKLTSSCAQYSKQCQNNNHPIVPSFAHCLHADFSKIPDGNTNQ